MKRLFSILTLLAFSLPVWAQSQVFSPPGYANMEWLVRMAETGDSTAQLELGTVYYNGMEGVIKDKFEAVKWFQKAADSGNPTAQLYLGYMYRVGDTVNKNYFKAIKLFRSAANHNNAPAMFYLGDMYEKGDGVKMNFTYAYAYYLLAEHRAESEYFRKYYANAADRLEQILFPDEIQEGRKIAFDLDKQIPFTNPEIRK